MLFNFIFSKEKEINDINQMVIESHLDINRYGLSEIWEDEGENGNEIKFFSYILIGDIVQQINTKKYYRIRECLPSYSDGIPKWYYKLLNFDPHTHSSYQTFNVYRGLRLYSDFMDENFVLINSADKSIISNK